MGRWESLESLWVTLGHFNSFCVSVELGARPLHKSENIAVLQTKCCDGKSAAMAMAICDLFSQTCCRPAAKGVPDRAQKSDERSDRRVRKSDQKSDRK